MKDSKPVYEFHDSLKDLKDLLWDLKYGDEIPKTELIEMLDRTVYEFDRCEFGCYDCRRSKTS